MKAFKIENARIETITDFDMVKFDVVTESGRVELAEHVNYDADGDFKSVERGEVVEVVKDKTGAWVEAE